MGRVLGVALGLIAAEAGLVWLLMQGWGSEGLRLKGMAAAALIPLALLWLAWAAWPRRRGGHGHGRQ